MKKQRTSLFRVLILSLVMLVTVFIIGIAWFATKEEATASGLSIRSSYGEGLDSSFDNANFATHIERKQLNLFKLPLITGDGTNFFIPKLDRATGTPVDASGNLILDGKNWVSKRDVKKATFPGYESDNETLKPFTPGDYYEEDIYFRSDKELDVYLTGLSAVTPLDTAMNTLNRKSDFGEFSKDNIAGAARIAFYNVTKTTTGEGESAVTTENEKPIFTWVPNDKYQLTLSENMTQVKRETAGSSTGGATFNPIPGQEEEWWNTLIQNDTILNAKRTGPYLYYYDSTGSDVMKAVQMWETDTEYFGIIDINQAAVDYRIAVFNFPMTDTINFPNSLTHFTHNGAESTEQLDTKKWSPKNVSWPITVSDPKTGSQAFSYELRDSVNTQTQFTYGDGQNYDKNLWWAKLYMKRDNNAFSDYNHWQVKVSYKKGDSASEKILTVDDVIYYKDKDNFITTPDIGSKLDKGTTGDIPYYELKDNSTILITNHTTDVNEDTYALNVNANTTTSVPVEMMMRTNTATDPPSPYLSPKNPSASMLFTVISAGSDASNFSQYKLKSVINNMYLTIKNGQIVLEDVAVEDAAIFKTLATKSTNGPMLQCNGMYVTYSNGSFGVSNTADSAVLQIYQGSSYGFNDKGEPDTSYQYYDKTNNSLKNLSDVSTIVTDTLLRGSSTGGGPQKVVKLVKSENSQSYVAHIRIRIWAEGTDREAAMPLAGGIFKTHLEFQGVLTGTDAPTNPPTEQPAA